MAKQYLNVCATPKPAMRDGYAGENAHITLPGLAGEGGLWFASGQLYTFPGSTAAQNASRTLGGTTKPDTFMKDCCSCING